jgi:GNAT superfamily N-acetyltransferase
MSTVETAEPTIRREFKAGDAEAIANLHHRVYGAEYGTNETFVAGVSATIARAVESGWPSAGGGVWLVYRDERLCGSLGLTPEGDGRGQVRWVVFEPSLRGTGLGRSLVAELVELARAQGMTRLELDTFSALKAAAHIYRSHGFVVVSERPRCDWGTEMTYQHYVADLR